MKKTVFLGAFLLSVALPVAVRSEKDDTSQGLCYQSKQFKKGKNKKPNKLRIDTSVNKPKYDNGVFPPTTL